MSEKEEIIGKLLKPIDNDKKSILITEIDNDNNKDNNNKDIATETTNNNNNNNNNNKDIDEGPSILELMMAAQAEARQSKEIETKKEQKKFGSGFAKGFFNDNTNKKKENKNNNNSNTIKNDISTSKSSSNNNTFNTTDNTINVVKKKEDDGKLKDIMKDVKKAMDDDTNPLLKQLQQGEWVTDDLKTVFQSNNIVREGFSNPKCMAAMELMKTNPNEAKKRFEGDPDVDQFMREFGKIMSDHFNKLGSNNATNTNYQKSGVQEIKEVQEVGPLQVEAMKRSKDINSNSTTTTNSNDDDVKKILNDPELSAMLMDLELQKILKECEDPIKFQYYMRDPIISKKIQKLWQAGLVGTAK